MTPPPMRERATRQSGNGRLRRSALALGAALALVGAPGPFGPAPVRALPAIILVDTTADAEFPIDGKCSLRAAILASNVGGLAGYCTAGTPEKDSIRFSLGGGTPVISLGSALPTITQPVTIAGNTGGATRIRLQGPGSGNGLTVNGTGSTIRNLVIDGFTNGIDIGAGGVSVTASIIGANAAWGIYAHGGSATIGGTNGVTPGGACTGDCNLIAGNATAGMILTNGGMVQGNLVGTNAAGTAANGNGVGIAASGSWTIGGTAAGAGNVVSGNMHNGMELTGCNGCTVQGNRVGTNAAGTAAVPNGNSGMLIYSVSNIVIGGSVAGAGNLISGNATQGIRVRGSSNVQIMGNRIGTTLGNSPLGNGGDGIQTTADDPGTSFSTFGSSDPAGGNTIAHNGGAGIRIMEPGATFESHGNIFSRNSIYANAAAGIVLEGAANDGIAVPVITGLGPVTGTACANCMVEIHSDNLEEGRIIDGIVVADSMGNWTYAGLFAGPNVTATATSLLGAPNTSEFGAPFAIPPTPFTDIGSSPFKREIEWLYANEITAGCQATQYCPSASVTREQMASFLVRMFDIAPSATDYFSDDDDSIHEADVNALRAAGITLGCTATTYCPKALVLRDQMATFLARAAELAVGAGRDYFNDDDGSDHEPNIDRNAAAGITTGCGAYIYCPASSVTREQMAAFLRRVIAPVPSPPYPAP